MEWTTVLWISLPTYFHKEINKRWLFFLIWNCGHWKMVCKLDFYIIVSGVMKCCSCCWRSTAETRCAVGPGFFVARARPLSLRSGSFAFFTVICYKLNGPIWDLWIEFLGPLLVLFLFRVGFEMFFIYCPHTIGQFGLLTWKFYRLADLCTYCCVVVCEISMFSPSFAAEKWAS